jgi:hypothetical protein
LAYLQQDGIAPQLIGEFGGRSIGPDAEGIWQRSLISFLEEGGFASTAAGPARRLAVVGCAEV